MVTWGCWIFYFILRELHSQTSEGELTRTLHLFLLMIQVLLEDLFQTHLLFFVLTAACATSCFFFVFFSRGNAFHQTAASVFDQLI